MIYSINYLWICLPIISLCFQQHSSLNITNDSDIFSNNSSGSSAPGGNSTKLFQKSSLPASISVLNSTENHAGIASLLQAVGVQTQSNTPTISSAFHPQVLLRLKRFQQEMISERDTGDKDFYLNLLSNSFQQSEGKHHKSAKKALTSLLASSGSRRKKRENLAIAGNRAPNISTPTNTNFLLPPHGSPLNPEIPSLVEHDVSTKRVRRSLDSNRGKSPKESSEKVEASQGLPRLHKMISVKSDRAVRQKETTFEPINVITGSELSAVSASEVHDPAVQVERETAQRKIWSLWGRWTPCSASCGSGFQTRWRECRGNGSCKFGERQMQRRACVSWSCRTNDKISPFDSASADLLFV